MQQWPFATQKAPSDRFTILIATIDHDDADHIYTRAVARAFLKQDGIDRIETCRVLRLSGVGRDAETTIVATARKWLEQRHADLLIGGELAKKEDAVSLCFIDNDPKHNWQLSTFRLDANLLKKDFSDAALTQLLGVALSARLWRRCTPPGLPTPRDRAHSIKHAYPVVTHSHNMKGVANLLSRVLRKSVR